MLCRGTIASFLFCFPIVLFYLLAHHVSICSSLFPFTVFSFRPSSLDESRWEGERWHRCIEAFTLDLRETAWNKKTKRWSGRKEEEEAVVIQVEEVRKVKDDKPTRNGYLPFLAASFFLKHKQPTLLLNPMTYIANVRWTSRNAVVCCSLAFDRKPKLDNVSFVGRILVRLSFCASLRNVNASRLENLYYITLIA